MKNFNLIKRLFMDSHEKQSPQRFFRYAAMLIMLLTIGVGQMWADAQFDAVYMVFDKNGTEDAYDFNSNSGHGDYLNGCTITTSLKVKKIYMKFRKYNGNVCTDNAYLGYNIGNGDQKVQPSWTWASSDHWGSDGNQLKNESVNHTIASSTDPSGVYHLYMWWHLTGNLSSNSGCSHEWWMKNGGSTNYDWTYKILPPAVKSGTVSISATNTAPGSGTGLTSGSPIILISGMASTLTITATQNHTDANSALWCKFGSNSYSSTTTYNIASGTTTTNQTLALKVKYRNNSASLDGAETTATIYYKWAAPAPAISFGSVSPAALVSGNDVTLVGTRYNSSNTISFQYSTDNGESWTNITPKTSSLSSNTLTATWTVPEAHGATQTYKFRAKLAEATPIYSGKSDGVTVYNTKTIHVRNINDWATFNSYVYNYSAGATTDKRENWPGSTTGITTLAGQWKNVVLTSQYTYFILNNGSSSSQLKGETYTYSGVSNDGYYTISQGSGSSLTLTSTTAPAAPTATTNDANEITSTTAKFNYSVNANRDKTTPGIAFKQSDDDIDAATIYSSGTKVAGSATNGNASGSTAAQTITPGKKYYYVAYGTNGFGTSYGTVKSFVAPYKVTITKPTGCSAMTPGTGSQYVKVGDNITATKATGYTFSSWSTTNVTLGDPSTVAGVTTSAITAISADNGTITASYTENMTTITITANNKAAGSVTVGGADFEWDGTTTAGVATTRALVVTAAPGYYFSGWTRSDGADFHLSAYGEANTSVTLTGDGAGETSGQTLTANFTELEKIYFRDVFDDGSTVTHWGDVYVYLGITWNGSNQAVTNSSHDDWRIHMTQIKGTNVWWAYVPRNFTTAATGTKEKVGFAKTNQNGRSYTFFNTKAATRGDYNKALNMFVPYHTAKYTGQNSVDYFDNGYWMKYDTRADQGAGYYLKRFNSKNNYTQEGEFIATNDDATFIQFSLRIDQSNTTKYYMITSAGNLNYVADAAVTSGNCTNVGVSENLDDISKKEIKFALTTTAEGIYTFVLDQSGDKMKLNVIYPVSIGDYRLIHSYNDGSTKTSHSDVIKAADVSGTTVSMYLNMDAGTKDLKLYKCTAITDGKPVWGSNTTVGTGSGLFNTTTFNKGNGVYVFDVAIASNEVSTISNAGLYGGDYYIKTNSAPGGWANYKQNVMEKNTINFSKTNTSTFDYSMCKWISDITTNVKCVIANDYNNAISDTLVSDAILTRGGKAYETLPEAANVRFSYNSVTNELKRTYLKGSTGDTKFVVLVPQASGYVYSAAEGGTDYYSSKPKFADNGNWTYQMDAWVYPGAQAGVQTSYPTAPPVTVQTLVPLTNYLMGGTKGSNPRYHVRLVYDFKTDYLMSAWVAGGNITQAMDLKSDFIVVRNGQSAADQISFSGSGAISEAKRAYGVFEFSKSAMVGNMGSWNATSYGLCMYYFSFPFDVKVSDIFGIGAMGTDWRIQKYNGAKRAEKGWFLEDGTTTFWEDVTEDEVLNAYEGYSLLLNRINFNNGSNAVWTNIPADGHTYLYFPSKDAIGNIENQTNVTIHVPEHECTIDREFSQDIGVVEHPRNHKYTDSHWNMVGTPLFQNKVSNSLDNCVIGDSTIKYIYAWNSSDNTLSARSTLSTSHTFNAMYAYMVQYAGDVKFTGASIKASIAARQKKETKKYTLELELNKGERFAGRTYIELRENANDEFELNEDLYMMNSSKTADIYTFAGSYDVAANVLSVNDHIIPVGLNVKSAGTYTFSMTNSFDGEVILVDNYAQTRTNLLLEDYEIALPKGSITDRFYLEINIKRVPTAIDGVEDGSGTLKDGKAHKYIENDKMYILQNGVIYDAQGKRVK